MPNLSARLGQARRATAARTLGSRASHGPRAKRHWRLRQLGTVGVSGVLIGSLASVAVTSDAWAQLTTLVTNSFTGNSTPAGQWVLPEGSNVACLTAGPQVTSSSVPNCSPTTDSSGSGALRLTTNGGSLVGAVFNTTSLPFSQGLDINFDTYQFDGTGADGISFALSVTNPANPSPPATPGPVGGSLGYSTDQSEAGLPYGYLGFGFDVFGNFHSSSYGGTTCSTTSAEAETVTVRGPGNGTSDYCILASSGGLGTDALDVPSGQTHNSSDMVPVEIALNPTGSSVSTPTSGLTVPADGFLVAFTPIGGTQHTLTGTLPDLSDYSSLGFPSSWFNSSTGYPYQVTFGWTASTGGSNEYHEVNTLASQTLNGPLPTLSLSDSDSTGGALKQGSDTSTITLIPSVSTANEASAPTVTDTFPTGVVPGTPTGTNWNCSASSGQTVSCTWTGGTEDAGSSFPSISVPVSVSSSATAGAGNDSAKISSDDALAAVAQDNFTVELLPGAPTSLSGSAKDSSVTLSWAAPANDGDSAITGYVVTPYINGTAQAAQSFNSTAQTETVTGLTAGTPYTFAVAAVNGVGTGPNSTQSGIITPNASPTITTPSLADGDTTVAYDHGISATGGTGSYTWSVTSGVLPPGLSLNSSTGAVSGTPTTTGSYPFTVGLTDQGGGSTSHDYTIDVASPPDITTASLPGGDIGQPYSQTVAATGGTAPLTWSILSGALPAGLLLGSSTGTISGTPTTAGTQTFTVEATDAVGATTSHAYTVSIADAVGIATASLPDDDVGVAYGPQTLAPSNGTAPYTWSIASGDLPTGLSLDPDSGELTGTPTTVGTYDFVAEVTDGAGQSATNAYTVVIASLPSVTPSSLPGGEQGVAYSQTVAVSEGTAPYTWSLQSGSVPPGTSFNTSNDTLSGTPTAAGDYSFTVQVTDSDGQSALQAYTVDVQAAPSITTISLATGEVNATYAPLTLTATAGTGAYSWSVSGGALPAGLTLDSGTGVISGTPTSPGSSDLTIEVTDAVGGTGTCAYTIDVVADPVVTTASFPGGEVGAYYSQAAAASYGTAPYTWSLASGSLPPGVSLDASGGTLSGTPTTAGNYTFVLSVMDQEGQGATSTSYRLEVIAAPSISPASLPGGELNVAYSQALTGSGGTTPYAWSLEGASTLPPGVDIDATTGLISGTPTGALAVGTDDFTVGLTDANGVVAQRSYVVSIAADPSITTGVDLPGVQLGNTYTANLSATAGTAPYSWSLPNDSQLPPGLSLGASSGAITGVPVQAGQFSFTVTVTDANGQSDTQSFAIAVSPPPALSPLTISIGAGPGPSANSEGSGASAPGPASGQVGTTYTLLLSASGGDGGPYSWTMAGGTLPPGLSLDASNGTVSGTPTASGSYTFTVAVTDGAGRLASLTVTIVVSAGPSSQAAADVNEQAQSGSPFSGTLPPPGPGNGNYRWSISSGALPAGLVLDPATGTVSGMAPVPGTYHLVLRAVGSGGRTYFEDVTFTVLPVAVNARPIASTPDGGGYWEAGEDGSVMTFGDAHFYGSLAGKHLSSPVLGIASTPDGRGYWLVTFAGSVYPFGDAKFYGSQPTAKLDKPIVGLVATPAGKGYWLVAATGGVYCFGDAHFYGSMAGKRLRQDIIGMAPTPLGRGYWLVGSDGGVFSFGDAHFYGSMAQRRLNAGAVGMAATPRGRGYWLVASDGGVFSFGDARFYGSIPELQRPGHVLAHRRLDGPITGIVASPDGRGYWMSAEDGGVFNFGDARFRGAGTGHLRQAQP